MRTVGFSWVGLLVSDFEKSIDFFSKVLGLSLDHEDTARVVAHFLLPSGQMLEVFGPSNRQRKAKYELFDGPVIGFQVDDLSNAVDEMKFRGAQFVTQIETAPDGDSWAYFLGPGDTLFTIAQSKIEPIGMGKSIIVGFSWAGVVFADFDGAVQFFQDVMAMPLDRRDDVKQVAQFWLPKRHLFEVFGPNNRWADLMPHPTIAFEIDDVRAVREELEGQEVEFITEVEVTSANEAFTYFRGPDGLIFEIWQLGE